MQMRIVLIAGLLLLAATIPLPAQERVALVIGNGKYVHAAALANPGNDAREVTTALREIGFDVAQGADLDRAGMERMIRDFLRKAAGAKVALLFYAGHGMQIDGRNYLVPVDAKLDAPSDLHFETIELDRLLDNLNDAQRATIVVLDACRDNPLSRSFASRLGAARSAAVGTGLAAYANPGTGTLIAFATAPGKIALDGQGANSPFTLGLMKHVRTPGLEVRQLLTRVRKEVADSTGNRQIPWDNSSLLGDVYLAGLPAATLSKPQAIPPSPDPTPAALPLPQRKQERRVTFQGRDGSTFLTGQLIGDASGNWTESNTKLGAIRLYFKTVSENKNEVILYDQSRDLYLRVSFQAKTVSWRQTARGAWHANYRITGVSN